MRMLSGILLAVDIAVHSLPMVKHNVDDHGDDQHDVSQACPLFSVGEYHPRTRKPRKLRQLRQKIAVTAPHG